MPVYNKRGILLLPKVIVLNPKDGNKPTNAIFHHFSADSLKKVVETMNFRLFALSQTLFSVTIKT